MWFYSYYSEQLNIHRKQLNHLIQALKYFDHLPSDYFDSNFDGYLDEPRSVDEHSPAYHSNSLPNQTSNSSFTSAPSAPPNLATPTIFPPTQLYIYNI